jgi:hypothetical protein
MGVQLPFGCSQCQCYSPGPDFGSTTFLPVPLLERDSQQGGSLVRQPVQPGPRKVDQPIQAAADLWQKVSAR